jgi:hypothetical protein
MHTAEEASIEHGGVGPSETLACRAAAELESACLEIARFLMALLEGINGKGT